MKAFDTDILTEILMGNPAYAQRITKIPVTEQAVPIVVVEDIPSAARHGGWTALLYGVANGG